MRPLRTIGPVGREPLQSGVVPAHGDVGAGTDRAELLAVLEHAAADGLFFDLGGSTVFVGYCDEVLDVQHVAIIGNLTANVNGFITDGRNSFKRSKYRPC